MRQHGPVSTQAEPLTPTAPRDPGRTVFRQRWRGVTFLHWPVRPEVVAPLLPPRVRPDTLDGTSYVGLIAFAGERAGVLGSPGLPYLGTFPEVNVRLYSVDEAGRRGVVFLSLDASRLVPVLVARVVAGLPYRWSAMTVRRAGREWTYTSRPRWPRPRPAGARSAIAVAVGQPVPDPSPLELFLTARWGLHLRSRRGRTLYWPNEHAEWPLHRATLVHLADDLVAAAGLPQPVGPPVSVLASPGVDARFGRRVAA